MERVLPEYITDTGKEFKRREYTRNEKAMLLQYLKEKGELCEAGGYVTDVIAEELTQIPDGGYRDDKYEWSTQDIFHIEKYNASVKEDFIKHVKRKKRMKDALSLKGAYAETPALMPAT